MFLPLLTLIYHIWGQFPLLVLLGTGRNLFLWLVFTFLVYSLLFEPRKAPETAYHEIGVFFQKEASMISYNGSLKFYADRVRFPEVSPSSLTPK